MLCYRSMISYWGGPMCGYLYHGPSSVGGTTYEYVYVNAFSLMHFSVTELDSHPQRGKPLRIWSRAPKPQAKLAAGLALQSGLDLRPILVRRRDPVGAIPLPLLPATFGVLEVELAVDDRPSFRVDVTVLSPNAAPSAQ